jgi:hypothetical protein
MNNNNLDMFQDAALTELAQLLGTMNVPSRRLDIANLSNVKWLLRNLRANNAENSQIDKAIKLLVNQHSILRRAL